MSIYLQMIGVTPNPPFCTGQRRFRFGNVALLPPADRLPDPYVEVLGIHLMANEEFVLRLLELHAVLQR